MKTQCLLNPQERSKDIVNRLRSSQTFKHYFARTENFFYPALY